MAAVVPAREPARNRGKGGRALEAETIGDKVGAAAGALQRPRHRVLARAELTLL